MTLDSYPVWGLWFSCSQDYLVIWLSDILALSLSVPDEGYSRNASCALNLISTFILFMIILENRYICLQMVHVPFVSCVCIYVLWSATRFPYQMMFVCCLTVTRQVSLVEQEIRILPEHLRSPPGFSEGCFGQSVVFY